MDIFIDAHQYGKIAQAESKAFVASEKAGRAQDAYYELRNKYEKMALACQALLEIVQERLDVSDSEIEEKILEIDLRDGRQDGKMSSRGVDCPACGRKTNTARGSCYYCGEKVENTSVFK